MIFWRMSFPVTVSESSQKNANKALINPSIHDKMLYSNVYEPYQSASLKCVHFCEQFCTLKCHPYNDEMNTVFVIHVRLFILSESDENLLLIFSNIL